MKKAKAVLYFALWLLPALAASVGYILVADRVCQIEASLKHGEHYKLPARQYADVESNRYQGQAPILSVAFKVAEAAPQNPSSSEKPNAQESRPESWIKKFFCEAKALDVALVLFTYCLVVVTGWLVYATIGLREETATLAAFAKQQAEDMKASIAAAKKSADAAEINASAAQVAAEHIPRVERAYLFGGPTNIKLRLENQSTDFDISVDNAGKTPGILKEICLSYFQTRPSGTPHYPAPKIVFLDAVINAGVSGQVIPSPAGSDQVTAFYVAGYIKYTDIFRVERLSRFCAQIHPAIGKFEPAGGEAWNEWT